MNPVLTFELDGVVHCLHTDAIPLQSLGTLEVHRATNIEFNSAVQQWESQTPSFSQLSTPLDVDDTLEPLGGKNWSETGAATSRPQRQSALYQLRKLSGISV